MGNVPHDIHATGDLIRLRSCQEDLPEPGSGDMSFGLVEGVLKTRLNGESSKDVLAGDAAVTTAKINDLAVTTGKIADAAVTAAKLATALMDPGARAVNVLRVASDVVHEEPVEVGDDTFEVEIVNTDSTDDTAGGDFNNETSPLVIDATDYAAITFAVGVLIRVESEIMRVSAVAGDDVTLLRGQSGTTIAAHADAEDIFVGDGVTAGSIAVGLVTTLTPAAFTDALVADLNEHATEAVSAIGVGDNEVLLVADAVGVVELACDDGLTGANNAWANATMYGGRSSAVRKLSVQTRVPDATEVALGNLHFVFDFVPVVVAVFVYVTATPGVATAWNGAVTVDADTKRVTLDNSSTTDWAATDTVVLIVSE